MAHVLSGCPVALDQGRYTWRLDSVLSQVAKFISQTIDSDVKIYCDACDRPWTIPIDIVANILNNDVIDFILHKIGVYHW